MTEEIPSVSMTKEIRGRSNFVMLMKSSVSGEFVVPNSRNGVHHATDKDLEFVRETQDGDIDLGPRQPPTNSEIVEIIFSTP